MREPIQKILHFLAGVIVIHHGLQNIESDDRSALFFLLLGLLILTLAFFHTRIEKSFHIVAGTFYWMEAAILFFIAFNYFEMGKKFLPWAYMLIGFLFCITGYFMIIKKAKNRRR